MAADAAPAAASAAVAALKTPAASVAAVALKTLAAAVLAASLLFALPACGPSDRALDARIGRAVDAALASVPAPPDRNAIYRRVWPSVFYIDPINGPGGLDGQHGAGWLLEPGRIVTAAHVVADQEQVIVRQATAPTFVATVAGRDARRDVALLTYDTARAPLPDGAAPLPLGNVTSRDIAMPLLALGYSGSGVRREGAVGSPKANAGILSQITNFGPESYGRNLEMDAAVDPGDSGGPVLNPAGEVIGMVRAAARQSADGSTVVGTFYAVHVDEIRAALAEMNPAATPVPPPPTR